MPQLISALNSGVKLTASGNTGTLSQIAFSGTADRPGFFPVVNPQTGAFLSGGALLTINPAPQPANTTENLMVGEALSLTLVFNANGQFRFNLSPAGSYAIYSQWFNVNTEHTVGVSYDTSTGLVILAVDGNAQSTYATFTGTTTTPFVVLGSNQTTTGGLASGVAPTSTTGLSLPGQYTGFIDQVLLFNSAQSATDLEKFTSDPLNVSNV